MVVVQDEIGQLIDMEGARQWTGRPESTIRRHCKPVKRHPVTGVYLYLVDDVIKVAVLRKARGHTRPRARGSRRSTN